MLRKFTFLLTLVVYVLSFAALTGAHDEPIASGLNHPRLLSFGTDGTLYIAEAGVGGDIEATSPTGQGTVMVGTTAQITAVSPDGEQSVFIPELLSQTDGFQTLGAHAILVTDDSIWLVLGQGPLAEDRPEFETPVYTDAVVQLDRESMEVLQVIDLQAYELEHNPDESGDLASNPVDLAVGADGTLYIVDASANAVLTWTEDVGLHTFAAWVVDETGAIPVAVPTSIAVGPEGDLYIGFLTGFPFATGAARIERWTTAGELVETYEGLTLVTDVMFSADGTLYAVQIAEGFGDTGFIPNSGSVVSIQDGEVVTYASGLNYPYGVAQNADGDLIVSINSAFSEPSSGEVIHVDEGSTGEEAEEEGVEDPAATPETQP